MDWEMGPSRCGGTGVPGRKKTMKDNTLGPNEPSTGWGRIDFFNENEKESHIFNKMKKIHLIHLNKKDPIIVKIIKL